MAHHLYEVPIIQQDLRHEEAIIQIADSLEYLNRVVNDVFNRIESRIESNQTRLDKLHTRASVTRSKVEKLTGSNKATKVFSSAKYPATELHKDYKSSFVAHSPIIINRCPEKIRSKHLPSEGKVLQEKLQFYHVKVSNSLLRRNIEIAPEEGLGSLPRDLDSISSLLLFNTSENPYKRYVMLDPLGAITKTRQGLEEEDDQRMEAAPITISQHQQLERQAGENYFYSPGLGEVPQIDVPLDLPDLPGVADDLRYSLDSGPTIAPSVSTTPAIPELPSLVPETPTTLPAPQIISAMYRGPNQPRSPPPPPPTIPPQGLSDDEGYQGPTQPPPPPPPPFPPQGFFGGYQGPTQPPPPPPQPPQHEYDGPGQPPPPPPPPPPPVFHSARGDHIPSLVTPAPGVVPGGPKPRAKGADARANLMEAIRMAGGLGQAMLKSAAVKKLEAKKRKQEEKAAGGSATGGDLMADLHAKLAMRRRGISGNAKSNDIAAMDRIRGMIPPPPMPEQSESASDDDDDWE